MIAKTLNIRSFVAKTHLSRFTDCGAQLSLLRTKKIYCSMVWNHNLSTQLFVLSSTVAVWGAGTGNWSNFLMISLSHSQSQLCTTSLCSNYTSVQWQFTVCHATFVHCACTLYRSEYFKRYTCSSLQYFTSPTQCCFFTGFCSRAM